MIRFIYGEHGSGKTRRVYEKIAEVSSAGGRCVLIVPEQHTVNAEKSLYSVLSVESRRLTEVLSFSRLANELSRRAGGLVFNYASTGVRRVVMQMAIAESKHLLREYNLSEVQAKGFADAVISVSDELRLCGIDPDDLRHAADSNPDLLNPRKFDDIALIISHYREILSGSFTEQGKEIERLADPAAIKKYFGDINFFIDSFAGMTGLEHRCCEALFRGAASVTVTVPIPDPFFRAADCVSQRRMSDRLRADVSGLPNEAVKMEGPLYRFRKNSLTETVRRLWNPGKDEKIHDDGGIRVVKTEDAYDEAEVCAAIVRSLAESGVRYREISVVARNAEAYRGIIDRAFEDAGIPLFFSEKIPLSHSSPSRLLLSAIRVLSGGWRREDVSSFLKTTLCPFDGDDIDLFELYTERWSIRGDDSYSAEWLRNPRGYKALNGGSDRDKLAKINGVRLWLRETLSELDSKIKASVASKDVKGVASALYSLLTSLDVRDKLNARSKECAGAGRNSEAAELASAFRGTVTALEQLCDAYGDERCPADLKELHTALSTLFDSLMLGSIPDSSDSTVFGSANMLRVESARYVMLLGVNCGEFPASTGADGLFSDDERDAFIKAGIRLMRDRESASSDELYFFRRAVASASEGVVIFSRNPGASVPVIRLKNIAQFSTVSSQTFLKERITSPRLAAEYEHASAGTPLGEALGRLVAECRGDGRLPPISDSPEPVSAVNYFLTKSAASLCYPKDMSLSQSAFESFENCPMKYVLSYKVGLSEGGGSDFSKNDAGIFVHYELEQLIKLIYNGNGKLISDYSGRKKEADRIARDYIRNNLPDISRLNRHTLERLGFLSCSIAGSVAKELSRSRFKPVAFELPIGGGGFPPLILPLSDGGNVSFSGKIDRVDVFLDGGVAWIRTVDYKTGNVSFAINPDGEVRDGSQLLFYLFNITRQNDLEYARRYFGGEPKEASVCYVSSGKSCASSGLFDEESISAEIAGTVARLGCMIDNESVARAADPENTFGENLKTVSQSDFDKMFKAVKDGIIKAVDGMKSGEASARGLSGACDFCPYSVVCRSGKKKR